MKFSLFLRNTPLVAFVLLLVSCSGGYSPDIEVTHNPFEISPLTAQLSVESDREYSLEIAVTGELPIKKNFVGEVGNQIFPIVGLYPNRSNKVILTFKYDEGELIKNVSIETGPLPAGLPTVQINKFDTSRMEAGLHVCDFHLANNGKFKSIPMAFDNNGHIRWYVDLSFAGKMVAPFRQLQNGNFLANSRHVIHEFDLLGNVKKKSINQNYGMHHEVVELPNGNLLIAVGKRTSRIVLEGKEIWSDSDCIILFDRKAGRIKKEWDLAKHLDVSRNDLNAFGRGDWLHMNGFVFLEDDLSLIISNKNQGLAKFDLRDQLDWILSPKKGWGKAGRDGNGVETEPYLLTAVDETGKPYEEAVQMGFESAEDFDFAWGNHAPIILPNGNLMVFDNGAFRNFSKLANYSRAVEYKIDTASMTVRQVWQYGKERGTEFFSAIVSDVDYLPETGNILITSGFLSPSRKPSGKIVEVDYETKEEVFEATLLYKNLNGNGTMSWGQTDILYRSDRIKIF